MATPRRTEHPQVELQIAPMIDVCFLLLFFYILTSKPMKQEGDMSLTLPGTVGQTEALDIPDEQRIEITQDGQVIINEIKAGAAGDTLLANLVSMLKRFKESADNAKSEALVTISAHDDSRHQRIVDVLNACATAGIQGVTFATSEDQMEAQ
jgi:biopolymer transport protein ExbD